MPRSLAFLAPVLLSFGGTAIATSYVIIPVTPPAATRTVVRDLIWACDGATCTARQDGASSRPAIICMATARAFGPLTAFSINGAPLDAEALAKCNSKAE